MARRSWKRYLPRKLKLGVSGRFFPVYGSAEWKRSSKHKQSRRKRS